MKSYPVFANMERILPNQNKGIVPYLSSVLRLLKKERLWYLVNHIVKNNPQRILKESGVPKVQATMAEHVHKFCSHCYNDPQTGATNRCYLHEGFHCIAMNSPYSNIENGISLCNIFNTFPPMAGSQVSSMAGKVCAYCHKRFMPNNNRQKYCTACTVAAVRIADNKRHRKHRSNHGK